MRSVFTLAIVSNILFSQAVVSPENVATIEQNINKASTNFNLRLIPPNQDDKLITEELKSLSHLFALDFKADDEEFRKTFQQQLNRIITRLHAVTTSAFMPLLASTPDLIEAAILESL